MNRKIISLFLLASGCGLATAQELKVRGVVSENGTAIPLDSAVVKVKGTSLSTYTNFAGSFELVAPKDATLQISHEGHKIREIRVENPTSPLQIFLENDSKNIQEVVLVGYGRQKKESVVGSQSSVQVEDLKVPVRDLTTAIAGRLSGVIATQRGGAPGQDGADLYIRGIATFASSKQTPLLVVDGVPDRSINNIDPEDIESFTILKDATAVAVYGVNGANGVILIKTKSGRAGKPVINVEMNSAYTQFTKLPSFLDGPTFMRLYNEGLTVRGFKPLYTEDDINKTASGVDPDLYPNVNWYDELFNKMGTNNRLNLNVSGGSQNATYYMSAGYYTETGMLKTDKVDAFNSRLKYDRFNYTTNVKVNLTPSTIVDFGVTGYISSLNQPAPGANAIFDMATSTAPHVIPARYSNGLYPQLKGTLASPYMRLTQSGVSNSTSNTLRSNLRFTQELNSILQGLSATAMFSFDFNSVNTVTRSRTIPTYWATGRDANGDLITQLTENGTYDLTFANANDGNRQFYMEGGLNYTRSFGNHDVTGLVLYNQTDKRYYNAPSYTFAIPYRQRNAVGRATYSYLGKYLLEGNFGYSGTDQFVKEKRFGLFPSVGAGWVVSKEAFYEPLRSFMNFFKLRYSYGKAGNSSIINDRFLFLSTLDTGGSYTFGLPGSQIGYTGYRERLIGGDVHWESSYRHNLGIEANFFKNSLQFIVELFKERRTGILRQDYTIGYESGYTFENIPYLNVGETQNKGIDFTMDFNKKWQSSFFSFRGTFTYNKNLAVVDGYAPWRYPWLNRVGHTIGQRFGYIATGLFATDDEAKNAPYQFDGQTAGDIRYKDLNGDGIINSSDQTAIGYGNLPRIIYGLNFGAGYKNVDISLFFQGAGLVDFSYAGGFGTTPFSQGPTYGNMYSFVLDRWTPDNPNPNALYPRLSTKDTGSNTNYAPSTWWTRRADYLRLKQAEIGYNIPVRDWNMNGINKMRLYLNGTNLLTFSKWKYWDPELGDGRGATYPNITTYNVGIRFTF